MCDYGNHGFCGITPIIRRPKKNSRVQPDKKVYHYDCYVLLYTIIAWWCCYVVLYKIIILLFAIIAIIPYYHYSQRLRSAFSEQNKTAGMGNTPRVSCWRRIPAAWSSRSVIDMDLWFLGSAHGVPTDAMCLRWTSMACRESNYCTETWTKHNTKRRKRTTLCMATDGSVTWMCTHDVLFHNLNETKPKCQQDVFEINREIQSKLFNYKMLCGALHTHQRRNARSRPMLNIHNSLTAKKNYWVNPTI